MSRRPGPPSWLLLWALGLLEWEVRVWVGSQAPPHPCFLQAAPKASMASSAVRNATVPTGVGATASTGPASVIQGSTAASATSVSPAACWLPPCPGRWGTGLSNGPGTCGAFLPQSSLCSAVTVYSDTRGPGGSARSPAGMGGGLPQVCGLKAMFSGLCCPPGHPRGQSQPRPGWWVGCRRGQGCPPVEAHFGFWSFLAARASSEPAAGSPLPGSTDTGVGEAVGWWRKGGDGRQTS